MSKLLLIEAASLKLISEYAYDEKDFTFIAEGMNSAGKKQYYVKGPYIASEVINRNRRRYITEEVQSEVDRLTRDYIMTNGLGGELNHPKSPEVDLERICHKILSFEKDGNVWIGKSMVTSGPKGIIMSSLIDDGFKIGMSTRAVGKVNPASDHALITELRLVTVDAVADPSYGEAFVNGIMENRQYFCNTYGKFEEIYETFDKKLSTIPRGELEKTVREAVIGFLAKI